MRQILALATFITLLGCDNKNYFAGLETTELTPQQAAIESLQQNRPTEAYNTLVATLPAANQEFLALADPKDENFVKDLSEIFNSSTLSETERTQTLPLLVQAIAAEQGVNFLAFAAKLAEVSPQNSTTLQLDNTCPVDKNVKSLIDSVKSVRNVTRLWTGAWLGVASWYDVFFQNWGPEGLVIAVMDSRDHWAGTIALVINTTFATVANFAALIATIDTDHDYHITTAEADTAFSGTYGYKVAEQFYQLMSNTNALFDDYMLQLSFYGKSTSAAKKAREVVLQYYQKLSAYPLRDATGKAYSDAKICGENRTAALTISCVQQWLVSITNC
jgi:hypothetical protein